MTRKEKYFVHIENKQIGTAAPIILNWYSLFYYLYWFLNDLKEAGRLATWFEKEAKAGDTYESDKCKFELKQYKEL